MYVNRNKYLYFIFLLSFIFFTANSIQFNSYSDEQWFLNEIDKTSLYEFLSTRYMTWTGRIIIEAIMVKTLGFSFFWKLAIPLTIISLSYSLWRMLLDEVVRKEVAIPVIIILIMSISPGVNADAVFWLAGFYNYLMPMSFLVYAIMILFKEDVASRLSKTISLCALSIACSTEQTAMVALASTFLYIFYKKSSSKFSIIFILFALFFTCLLLSAPGNASRFNLEIVSWFPEYREYNFIQKIMLGVDRLNAHICDKTNVLFNLVVLSSLYLIVKSKKNKWLTFFAATILTIKLTLFITYRDNFSKLNFFNFPYYLSADNWSGYDIYMSFAFSLLVICCIIYGMICRYNISHISIALSFIMALSLLSVMALGFSPTVYASGQRILFCFNVGMIAYMCLLYRAHKLYDNHFDLDDKSMVALKEGKKDIFVKRLSIAK